MRMRRERREEKGKEGKASRQQLPVAGSTARHGEAIVGLANWRPGDLATWRPGDLAAWPLKWMVRAMLTACDTTHGRMPVKVGRWQVAVCEFRGPLVVTLHLPVVLWHKVTMLMITRFLPVCL